MVALVDLEAARVGHAPARLADRPQREDVLVGRQRQVEAAGLAERARAEEHVGARAGRDRQPRRGPDAEREEPVVGLEVGVGRELRALHGTHGRAERKALPLGPVALAEGHVGIREQDPLGRAGVERDLARGRDRARVADDLRALGPRGRDARRRVVRARVHDDERHARIQAREEARDVGRLVFGRDGDGELFEAHREGRDERGRVYRLEPTRRGGLAKNAAAPEALPDPWGPVYSGVPATMPETSLPDSRTPVRPAPMPDTPAAKPRVWFNGELVNHEDATIHVLSHVVHYGSSVFEGIRCYDTDRGPAVFRLREHLRRLVGSAHIHRMTADFSARPALRRRRRDDRGERARRVLHPPDHLPRARPDGRQPARQPRRDGHRRVGVGPVPRRRGARARASTCSVVVEPPGAEHAAGDGQGRRQLPRRPAHQDGGHPERLRRGHRADGRRLPLRGLGREPLPRPRRRPLHRPGDDVDPAGHHPRHRHDARARDGLEIREQATARARRSTSPTSSSSPAPPPRSRRSARSTITPSARAAAGRSRRASRRPTSRPSATRRTRTGGSRSSPRPATAASGDSAAVEAPEVAGL